MTASNTTPSVRHAFEVEGLDFLYNYTRANLDWLEKSLRENVVYCSSPHDFNDPWDCRPQYDLTKIDDPSFQIELFTNLATTSMQINNRTLPKEFISRFQSDPAEALRWFLSAANTSNVDLERNPYRIFCLSKSPNSILQWAYYGDKHQGICLQFSTKNDVFASALEVEYHYRFPFWDYLDRSPSTVLRTFLTKAHEWHREEEFRIIAEEGPATMASASLHTKNSYLEIPDTSLTQVILGCRMPSEMRDKIVTLVRATKPSVGLAQAIAVPGRYELEIQPLTP